MGRINNTVLHQRTIYMKEIFPIAYLLDDDASVRQGLSLLLPAVGISVRAYADPETFLREFDPERPCAILLDVCMPDIGGMAVLDKLRTMNVSQPVIVLTRHGTVELCRRAFKAGASEFLEKPVNDVLLIDTLQQCLKNYLIHSGHTIAKRHARERYKKLSVREREVLSLIVAGLTSREIGRALNVSPRTVEVHRAHLVEKLETDTLASLVREYAPLVENQHT